MSTWHPLPPVQVRATVPRRIPGGPVVRRRVVAYRGAITRQVDGQREPGTETCAHAHAKPRAAAGCADRMAASLNRQARDPAHTVWPATQGLRTAQGFPLRHVPATDAVLPSVQPLRAVCQPCGRPIYRPAGQARWEHADNDVTAWAVAAALVARLGDGAEAYAATTATLEGGAR